MEGKGDWLLLADGEVEFGGLPFRDVKTNPLTKSNARMTMTAIICNPFISVTLTFPN